MDRKLTEYRVVMNLSCLDDLLSTTIKRKFSINNDLQNTINKSQFLLFKMFIIFKISLKVYCSEVQLVKMYFPEIIVKLLMHCNVILSTGRGHKPSYKGWRTRSHRVRRSWSRCHNKCSWLQESSPRLSSVELQVTSVRL